jgi:hypothetical protein
MNEARNSFDFAGVDTCSSTLSNSYRGGAGWGEKPSSCRSGILNPSWPSRGDVYQRHPIPCPVGRVRISLYRLQEKWFENVRRELQKLNSQVSM